MPEVLQTAAIVSQAIDDLCICQEDVPNELNVLTGVAPEDSVFFAPFKTVPSSVDSALLYAHHL